MSTRVTRAEVGPKLFRCWSMRRCPGGSPSRRSGPGRPSHERWRRSLRFHSARCRRAGSWRKRGGSWGRAVGWKSPGPVGPAEGAEYGFVPSRPVCEKCRRTGACGLRGVLLWPVPTRGMLLRLSPQFLAGNGCGPSLFRCGRCEVGRIRRGAQLGPLGRRREPLGVLAGPSRSSAPACRCAAVADRSPKDAGAASGLVGVLVAAACSSGTCC